MIPPVDTLSRIGVKIFTAPGADFPGAACIPIFHRWIQTAALDGLLIDVADYTHLADGPQVILVGHAGNLAVDTDGGRLGLRYTLKRPPAGPLVDRILGAVRTAAAAGRLLETDSALGARVEFLGNTLDFTPNDRLRVPAAEAQDRLGPAIRAAADRLFPDREAAIALNVHPPSRVTFTVTHPSPLPLTALIARTA